jgi:hypothetical protein
MTIHYKHTVEGRYTQCGRDTVASKAYNRGVRGRQHVLQTTQDHTAVTCEQCRKALPAQTTEG